MNINAKTTPIKEFFETAEAYVSKETNIENRAFAWRGKAVIDRNLDILDNKNKSDRR